MRITSKGQVTIPVDIRERAGLLPDTEVEFRMEGEVVMLRPVVSRPVGGEPGQDLIDHLAGFADDITMTADELMALTRDR